MMDERETTQARTIDIALSVFDGFESKRLILKAVVADVTDIGMTIATDFPLETGHVLFFGDSMNLGHELGIVARCERGEDIYRAEIRFR